MWHKNSLNNIREEELTKQFNEAVSAIKLKDDDIEFIKICLKASLDDKIQYTEERIVLFNPFIFATSFIFMYFSILTQ